MLSLLMTAPLPGEITGDVAVVVVLLLLQAATDNMSIKIVTAAAVINTFFINSSLPVFSDLFYRDLTPFF
jgi:hypothetical protein